MIRGCRIRFVLPPALCVQAAIAYGQPRAIPGYEGLTQEVIDRALRAYGAARSYQDELTIEIEQNRADGRLAPADQEPASLSFRAPNRILLETPVLDVYCDGDKLRLYAHGINQYMEFDAPARIDFNREPLASWSFYEWPHPVAWLIGRPGKSPADLLAPVERFTDTTPDSRDGRPGHCVRGRIRLPHLPTINSTVPFDAWFNEESHLLEEFNLDLTQAWQEIGPQLGPQVLVRYTVHFRFDRIRLDGDVPNDHFTFKPAHDPRKVSAFEMPLGPRMELLLNRRTPDFRVVQIDENLLALAESREETAPLTLRTPADHRGRVLLLMLWKPSCIACVSALPHLQRLADAFRNRPLAIVGVLGGEPMGIGAIHRYLEAERIAVPHLFDAYNWLFGQYRPITFPTFVLIDHQGVVRDVLEGYLPGQEERLRAMIEKGLADSNRRREEEKVVAGTTVQRFLAAATAGNETAAAGLVWPVKLPIDRLVQMREKIDVSRLKVTGAFKDEDEGLVLAVATADGGQAPQHVVFDLTRVDLTWIISGLEPCDAATVQARLGRFLEQHPAAQPEQPIAATRPATAATTAPAGAVPGTQPAVSAHR